MDLETTKKAPLVYWLVAVAVSFWNLMGCIIFFSAILGGEAMLEGMTEVQKEWARSLPAWIYVVFGIAIVSGVLGCVSLWIRKKVSFSLFLISLAAVLVQQIYSMFIAGGFQVMGAQGLIMPGIVTAIAFSTVWFSMFSLRKGWLN